MAEKVIIIGGGPSGLAASIYLARAGLKPLVVAGSPPGGQLTLTSEVENYPGFESILGPELISKMRKHAGKFGVRFIDENVIKTVFSKKPFVLHIPGKARKTAEIRTDKLLSESVIITTGAKALWLGLESETKLRGKGVSACATCDGFFFRNKKVGVIGGGDTAMEEALTLTKFAEKVYVVHRRNEFRASKVMQDRVLKHPKIEVVWNSRVEEIIGQNRVEGIRLAGNSGEAVKQIDLDGVFIAIGHKPDTEIFKGQIELDKKGYIITAERYAFEKSELQNPNVELISDFRSASSVPGVFAAGDCVDHIYKQAATAVGMGVAAALDVEKYLTGV